MSKTKRVSFVDHLFAIVSDAENNDMIRWRDDGGFTVLNATKLSKQVLPRYFKHDNYCSFVRQLSNYHFVTIADGGDARPVDIDDHDADAAVGPFSFRHESNLFQRGRLDLLAKIERRRAVKRSVEPRAREDGGDHADAASTVVKDEPFDVRTDVRANAELSEARATIAAQQQTIQSLEATIAQLRSELMTSATHVANVTACAASGQCPNTPVVPPQAPPPMEVAPLAELGLFEDMSTSQLIPRLEPLSSSTSGSSPLVAAPEDDTQLGLFGLREHELELGVNGIGLGGEPGDW